MLEVDMKCRLRRLSLLFLAVAALHVVCTPARAQGTYEIRHDTISASGWFGGDNRQGANHRSVGVGQSVLIDSAIALVSFAFNFTNYFDYPANPDFMGHEVTLKLNVRDSTGRILKTDSVIVPAAFPGGWVTWTNLDLAVQANTRLIFTSYLVGASTTHQYFTGQAADAYSLYLQGDRYAKEDTTDTTMDAWSDWVKVSWDSAFLLEGTLLTTGITDLAMAPVGAFQLGQNFPNPFNPTTQVRYQVPGVSEVTLVIYDVLGRKVATLVDEAKNPGMYTVQWDASGMASGIYFCRLSAGASVSMIKMILLR
jgi:hypothetical protein